VISNISGQTAALYVSGLLERSKEEVKKKNCFRGILEASLV
jgi:hypothetical protein